MNITVVCAESQQAEPMPLRLEFGHRTVDVTEIIDRWPAPSYCYIKLKGHDGGTYILRQDVPDRWRLVLFERQREEKISRIG
jgi:hypothetical protein